MALRGESAAARAAIERLDGGLASPIISPIGAISILAILGDHDKAIESMNAFVAGRSSLALLFASALFTFGDLDEDPRFWEIIEEANVLLQPGAARYEKQQAYKIQKAAVKMLAEQGQSASAKIDSLAVLPLRNLSPQGDQDYFAESMTEAITGELAKIKALQIRGRTSAMQYKDTDQGIPEIAKALNVDALIEGSVTRDGDEVRIDVRLMHGATDTPLSSFTRTETITSVLKLQSDVALAIADAVNTEITGEERDRIATTRKVDPKAHAAYVLGNHYWSIRTREGLLESERQFESAVNIDPEFAEAWSGLGYARIEIADYGYANNVETKTRAREAFERALEIDPELGESYAGLAEILGMFELDWATAGIYGERAVEIAPSSVRAHTRYGIYAFAVGQSKKAIELLDRAVQLDPNDFDSMRIVISLLQFLGETEKSAALADGFVARNPDYRDTMLWELALIYAVSDRIPEAIETSERFAQTQNVPLSHFPTYAYVLAMAGRHEESRRVLDSVANEVSLSGLDTWDAARAYVEIGELDKAFETLESIHTERAAWVALMKNLTYTRIASGRQAWRALASDDRFWELFDRIGLPPFPADHPGHADEMRWMAKKAAAEMLREQGVDGAPAITSLAVLPFENVSGDTEKEYFVDGMTGALTSELSKISSIKVIGRASAMHYKDTDKSPREIAEELDVGALITGSALQVDDQVRITAELMHAASQTTLWSNNYDDQSENILKIHSKVALDIAEEIQAALTPEVKANYAATQDVDPAAYNAYLLGMSLMEGGSERGFRRAIDQFTLATELDPDVSTFFAWLATAYFELGIRNYMVPTEAVELPYEHASRALELNNSDPEAHIILSMLHWQRNWDWSAAEESSLKAIKLDANSPLAHFNYAFLLNGNGRIDKALREMEIALKLDPTSDELATFAGEFYMTAGDYDKAQTYFEAGLRINPDDITALGGLAIVQREKEEWDSSIALSEREIAVRGRDADSLTRLARTLARKGDTDKARELLTEILEMAEQGVHSPGFIALLYLDLDDADAAIEWLEKAFTEKEDIVSMLRSGMMLPYFRHEPRFWDIAHKVGLPPLPPEHPDYAIEQAYLINKRAEELIAERGLVPSSE